MLSPSGRPSSPGCENLSDATRNEPTHGQESRGLMVSPPPPTSNTSEQNQTAFGSGERTGRYFPLQLFLSNRNWDADPPAPRSVFQPLELVRVVRVQLLDLGLCESE